MLIVRHNRTISLGTRLNVGVRSRISLNDASLNYRPETCVALDDSDIVTGTIRYISNTVADYARTVDLYIRYRRCRLINPLCVVIGACSFDEHLSWCTTACHTWPSLSRRSVRDSLGSRAVFVCDAYRRRRSAFTNTCSR